MLPDMLCVLPDMHSHAVSLSLQSWLPDSPNVAVAESHNLPSTLKYIRKFESLEIESSEGLISTRAIDHRSNEFLTSE